MSFLVQSMSNDRSEHSEREGVTVLDGFLVDYIFAEVNLGEYVAMANEIRTFCHQFKSNTVNSTRLRSNTSEGIVEAIRSSELWSRWTVANNEARLRKLHRLPSISLNESKFMPAAVVRNSRRPIFFCGDDSLKYGRDRIPPGGIYLSAKQTLDVVDSTHGFYLKGVCTLLPREEALSAYKKRQSGSLFNAFVRMAVAGKSNSRVSSKTRVALASGSVSGKYISKGIYAARNRRGLAVHSNSEVRSDKARRCVSSFFRSIEEKAKGYIDARQLLFLDAVRRRLDYNVLRPFECCESAIWPSVAFGKDVFLRVHRDEDYFWSLTTVVTKEGYETNADITNYFCFPTHGFCIALRPGDMLIFNALEDHCASSICRERTKSFGVSLYLKTAVVAGNCNTP
jgi:hypothetical protein